MTGTSTPKKPSKTRSGRDASGLETIEESLTGSTNEERDDALRSTAKKAAKKFAEKEAALEAEKAQKQAEKIAAAAKKKAEKEAAAALKQAKKAAEEQKKALGGTASGEEEDPEEGEISSDGVSAEDLRGFFLTQTEFDFK